jgi:preprotein translocase subunit SecG
MVVQLILSVALIGVILLQSSKGEGLGSIGGGGSLFHGRAKGLEATLDKLTKVLATAFVVLSVALSIL